MRKVCGVLAAGAVLLISGCATDIMTKQDRAMMSGRYGELQRVAESEVPDITRASTAKLTKLCLAYHKLKRYDKVQVCYDQLEKNVARGDTNMTDVEAMQKQSPLLMGLARMGSAMAGVSLDQDVTPFLYEARAETEMDLGNYPRAIEFAKRMRAWKAPQWNQERWHTIHSIGVLALAHALNGDRDVARKLAAELEEVSTSYPYVLLATDKQIALAKVHIALGQYERAHAIISEDDNSFFRAAADLVSGGATLEGGSLLAFVQIQRSFMLHKSELETGKIAQAKKGYDELLKDVALAQNGDIYWVVLYDRGRIAEREGNSDEAIGFYRRSVEVIESQRSTLNTEASKIGFAGDRQKVYQDLVRQLIARGQSEEAFNYVERSKARALVDMLAQKQDFAINAGNVQQVEALLRMKLAEEREARSLPGAEASGTRGRTLQVAERQLADQAPELASLVSVRTLTAAQVRQRLPADETLIEYYAAGDSAFAFVVTRSGLAVVPLNGKDLTQEVQSFRRVVQTPAEDARPLAQALHARLIAPLGGRIATPRLTIVAHGPLHYLPFAALHDGRAWLAETRVLRNLPAASVLEFLKTTPAAKPGELLAFGNPDLGNPKYDLAFAEAEARAITEGRPNSRALLRREASESAFRRFAEGFRYVHIASHGEFEASAPLRSALRLAPDAANDGALTVGELYTLKIDADLVTLSACETGLGLIANGDDVVGLTRGFLYAGARSIVSSLWQVDDRATGVLMSAFYGALGKGTERREALVVAQRETMKQLPHPFYWAAFGLTGA